MGDGEVLPQASRVAAFLEVEVVLKRKVVTTKLTKQQSCQQQSKWFLPRMKHIHVGMGFSLWSGLVGICFLTAALAAITISSPILWGLSHQAVRSTQVVNTTTQSPSPSQTRQTTTASKRKATKQKAQIPPRSATPILLVASGPIG